METTVTPGLLERVFILLGAASGYAAVAWEIYKAKTAKKAADQARLIIATVREPGVENTLKVNVRYSPESHHAAISLSVFKQPGEIAVLLDPRLSFDDPPKPPALSKGLDCLPMMPMTLDHSAPPMLRVSFWLGSPVNLSSAKLRLVVTAKDRAKALIDKPIQVSPID